MSPLHTKLYIRADAVEKAAFERAARLSGMSLSVWVRFELRRVAAEALEKAGVSIGVEKGPPIGMEKGPLLIIGSGSSPESIGGTRA